MGLRYHLKFFSMGCLLFSAACQESSHSNLHASNSPDFAEIMQNSLDDYIHFTGEPGIAMSINLPQGISWQGASGVSNIKTQAPLSPNDLMEIGSNTKTFVSVVTLQLAEEGLINLEDPLAKHLPQYSKWSDITIRQLLQMSAGIPDYSQAEDLVAQLFPNISRSWSPEEIINLIYESPLDYSPGEDCSYSQTNYIVLGLLIETVTGQPLAQEFRTRIFDPLELQETFYGVQEEISVPQTVGYSTLSGIQNTLVRLLKPKAVISDQLVAMTQVLDSSIAGASGAISSSAGDLRTFTEALFIGNRLLSDNSKAEMMAFQECKLGYLPLDYGLGLMRWQTSQGTAIGHGGATPLGFRSTMLFEAETKLAVTYEGNYDQGQIYNLLNQHLKLVKSDKKPQVQKACPIPDQLHSASSPYSIRFSIKGTLNDAPNNGNFWGEDYLSNIESFRFKPFHGQKRETFYNTISLTLSDDNAPSKIQVVASAFEDKDGPDSNSSSLLPPFKPCLQSGLRSLPGCNDSEPGASGLIINIDEKWLEEAASNSRGIIEINDISKAAAIVLRESWIVAEGDDDKPNGYIRSCVEAISDPYQTSRLYTCGDAPDKIALGKTVRLHGSLNLTDDPEIVSAILKSEDPNKETCTCRSFEDEPIACP
ncbi:serine hydrolase domain-containing protein [Pseudobacteriovorax antillogorgiicola]|uniref:CubicO group peptidase, beta-lactamase class C family n=1 Tax=Pseudobacteriovorax antillogorgiicola TaxID=1513793 RepID=A0A1Y6CJU9_9BACT|nr:serine hydrolase domain-containing protein [Pseudobacteriovorax antillogorgiicola]TCS46155.1 CubicO group peptidase (beta-lactamase class C family) [Pseudobacteriovorax antillogorgiicola]SMF69836.1 CubicO group peptidase, beta-lactamase class C family [Pseudobacteriovorax antillogorgiicola]